MADLRVLARVSLAAVQRGNALLADILAGAPPACALFTGAETAGLPPVDRAALAEMLFAQQERFSAGALALANARRLADPATPVVTVGQQPGLLTGPLYTMYKAITAVTLAHRAGAVPVFWIGADDDDRAEIDHCALWDADYRLHDVHYPADAGVPGQPVGSLPAGPAADAVLAQVLPLLAGSCAGAAEALLRETLVGSPDLGTWFARLLARLFAPWGLVCCDPRDPALRRLSAPVLQRELAAPLATTALVNDRARDLHALGYRPALTKPAEVCNLFLQDARRQRVTFADGCFHAGGRALDAAALAAEPERLVPNAVLRPVVQEYLFGSSAFVAGPNEVCYWAELAPVFAQIGVRMPPVVARAGATLVPARAARHLRAWAADPLQLLFAYDRLRLALLERAQPEAAQEAFTLCRAELDRVAALLAHAAADVDPTLAASAAAAHQRMLHEVERVERKALAAVERQHHELTNRLETVRETLFPGGGLQERLLSVASLVARHGETIVADLLDVLDGQEGMHCFVEL